MMRKTKTPNAAEQNKIREEATVTLRRALADRSFRPTLFLGPRTTARRATPSPMPKGPFFSVRSRTPPQLLMRPMTERRKLHQMDITRTPTFSKAVLPSGCGCDVKPKLPVN